MKTTKDINTLVRANIRNLLPYSSARDEFKNINAAMVFLDANENPFKTNVNRYPDPQQRNLKQRLASQKRINSSQIILGNGSDEILDLIMRAFCEPNKDNIITLPPTYGMYKVLAGINAIENKEVLLDKDWEPDITRILEQQDKNSKLLFLCIPNNPTGNTFATKKIEKLLKEFNGIIVIDEAYIDFSSAESWISKLQEYPNLIVTQTLSKAYGMAGIRLGICYASTQITTILNKIKPPYNVNTLTQERALKELVKTENIKNDISLIIKEKNTLSKALLDIFFVKKIHLSDTNFILIKVDNATKRYEQLLQEGIVVRNRSTQPLCENTLRITVGTPQENIKLIKTLRKIS